MRWRDAQRRVPQPPAAAATCSGLGAKTFEQSAGFLRIRGGDNPLDLTGVHPETYPVVEQMLAQTGKPVGRADGPRRHAQDAQARGCSPTRSSASITVKDILGELEKPGRDPRPDFKVARFNDGVEDIKDLQPRAWCSRAR